MASYLRPRRGKKSTAISQNIVLKRGEIFMEVPDTGVGTGIGRIKLGDGTTAYQSLPYFMNLDDAAPDVAASVINYTDSTDPDEDVKSGKPLKTIIGALKKLVQKTTESVEAIDQHWVGGTYNGDYEVIYWSSANYDFIKGDSVVKVYANKFGKTPKNIETTLDGANVRINVYFEDEESFNVLVCIQNPIAV